MTTDGLYPYKTTITYGCFDGRRFINGQVLVNITCGPDAYWSMNNVTCVWPVIFISKMIALRGQIVTAVIVDSIVVR